VGRKILIHISEPTRLRRISYADDCEKKKVTQTSLLRQDKYTKLFNMVGTVH